MTSCTTRDRVRNTATVENAFKDFTELYVKNPNKARELFPQVAQYMENVWSKAFPQSAKELQKASTEYADWQKNATPLDLVKSQIKFDRPDSPLQWFKKKIGEIFNKESLERNFLSKLAPIRKISPQAEQYAEVYAGAAEAAVTYTTEGRFKYSEDGRRNEKTGKSLSEIVEPVIDNYEDASAYLAARTRSEDLRKQGKTDSAKYIQDVAAMRQAERQFPQFKEFGNEFTEYMKDNLAFARDAQLISQKSYDQMVNSHEMYAPLYRVVEGSNRAGLGTTGGMEPKDAVKARTNVESGYDILDPIQTAYNNSALIVAMSERNGVMRKLAKDAKGTAAQGLFEEVTTPKKSKEELLKSIKDKGLPVEYFKDLPAEVIEVLTENPIVKGENTVNVFEDGVKKSYAVDPAIYEAIKGLGTAREGGILMKLMSYPAQGLRFGATITPAYMAKAFIRDIPHALTTSQYGLTLPDIVRGTFSAFKKDAWYEEFVRSGGAYSSASSLTRDAWSKNIDQMRKAKDRGFFKRAVKDNWLGLKKIQEWNHAFENAPRVAEFRKGIEKGATRQEAAHAARNITLDFQKKGAIAEVVNSIVPFSNAFIQGNAQFVKYMKPKTDANGNYTFKDTAVPYLRAIGYFGVPALINSMLNADNERVRNQAQWEQDSFYNVDMAPFYDDKKNAPIIKIPKTQEFGVFLGNAIEAAVYAIHDKDPKGFKTFAEETLAGYTTSRLFIPTAVAPALEAWANKMFFFNTPVVPYGREGLLPAEQFNERGTQVFVDLSRGLAKIFGDENTFRPAVVENYVNRWSGALGTSLIDGIDKAYKIIGGTDEFKAEDLNYFLKSFYTDYPTMSAKPIREFFDNYKSTEQVHKTIQKLVKEGRQDEAVKLNQKYNKVRQTPTYKAVTRMMHFMKEVKALDMDSARKKELIYQTMLQLIQVAEQANKIMDF